MDFAFTEEADAIGELARQILAGRSDHTALRVIEKSDGPRFDPSTWAEFATAGLIGATIPESFGGAGLDQVALGRALVEVGRAGAALPLWETAGLAAPALVRWASESLADELSSMAAGQLVATAAWQEPSSDPALLATTAGESGGGWNVSGRKTCVPAGAICGAVLVPATTSAGPALFWIAVGEGTTVIPLLTTSGSPDADLEFVDAPATLVATGAESLAWAFEVGVAAQCALALGHATAMLELTASYTKERKQFDVPIASFQAVGHRAADCYIDVEAIRLTTWQALSRLDEGLDAHDEVSIAKYWVASAGHRLALAAAHLHGGVGVDRDYPLARHFTRMKELELLHGGATSHLLRIGAALAGRPQ